MSLTEKTKQHYPNLKYIFEIGAHRGCDIEEINRLWPEAYVYAFEADPNNFEICFNKFKNNPKVQVLHLAVTSSSGKMTFNRYYDVESIPDEQTFLGQNFQNTGQGSLKKPGDGMKNIFHVNEVYEEFIVDTISLYDFCIAHNIPNIDAIFMDVQGSEFDVFCGCKDFLNTIKATVFEWSTNRIMYDGETDFNIIKAVLENAGLHEIEREYQFHGISGDSLFVR
jgi:FkbM family methyltransferase